VTTNDEKLRGSSNENVRNWKGKFLWFPFGLSLLISINGDKNIMTKDAFFGKVKLPLSGDVTQAINPWSWWLSSMRQFGFVNINQMESSNPEMEREILENVASYGRQLGRIIEALSVALEHTQFSNLTEDEQQALECFTEMATEIAAVKGGYVTLSEETLDHFLAGIRRLKDKDPQTYQNVVDRLRQELL
jgi:hypothetical protein